MFESQTVLMPGVFNAISAITACKANASALYLSGAGISNATLGLPDIALATLTEFATQASLICAVSEVPILSDADTGFGETWNVVRTVLEMERAGLAGIHIEDQVMPKRCGHLDGKSLIPPEQMAQKVVHAVAAKNDPDFLIVARTDARGIEGLPSSIERAKRYQGAGADAIFPEGLESEEEFERFRSAISLPLLANMTEFGKTPIISHARFRELGYQMVIFPMTAFRTMLATLDRTYREILASGTQLNLLGEMKSRRELYDLIDYRSYIDADATLGAVKDLSMDGGGNLVS
jgi:methylisocitrate lyase